MISLSVKNQLKWKIVAISLCLMTVRCWIRL